MTIVIQGNSEEIDEKYPKLIIAAFKSGIKRAYIPDKFIALDKYIKSNHLFGEKTCAEILSLMLKNMIITTAPNEITIQINPRIYIPDTPYKLLNACKFITFGALGIAGQPLIESTMKSVAKKYQNNKDLQVIMRK